MNDEKIKQINDFDYSDSNDNNINGNKKIFGWIPSKPDPRDVKFHSMFKYDEQFPDKILLDKFISKNKFNQGTLGSCTANAIASAYMYNYYKLRKEDEFNPSRLFIYYCERELMGTVSYDSGASLRDGMKVLNKIGTSGEKSWPYDIEKFTIKPPRQSYKNAQLHKVLEYMSVNETVNSFKDTLNKGFPIIIGFSVPESFLSKETAFTGFMLPYSSDKIIGGHAVLIYGYDDNLEYKDKKGYFRIRNSWGEEWGSNGDFYMPYENVEKLCADCWAITKIKIS